MGMHPRRFSVRLRLRLGGALRQLAEVHHHDDCNDGDDDGVDEERDDLGAGPKDLLDQAVIALFQANAATTPKAAEANEIMVCRYTVRFGI